MQTTQQKETRIWITIEALDQVKRKYPETTRLTYTGIANWALRKLVEIKKET